MTSTSSAVSSSKETVRESVRLLLKFIPEQQQDEEHSNSAVQRRLLEDIRWAVLDAHEGQEKGETEKFDAIMSKQERLIQEIQKRTRMLVGV